MAGVYGWGPLDPAGHTLEISAQPRHVEIAVDGVTIAASDRALVMRETGLPPRHLIIRARRP